MSVVLCLGHRVLIFLLSESHILCTHFSDWGPEALSGLDVPVCGRAKPVILLFILRDAASSYQLSLPAGWEGLVTEQISCSDS